MARRVGDAGVWVATGEDVPGFATGAHKLAELMARP